MQARSLIFTVLMAFGCFPAAAQTGMDAADKRILEEVRTHNKVSANIEYLSDMIGPRLTGSEHLRAAESWASGLAQQYGLENVHLEGWTVAHAWQRGSAEAQILGPTSRKLRIVSAGWSPSTRGSVRGKIIHVAATNHDELQAYRGKLRGAIVILDKPSELLPRPKAEDPFMGLPIQMPSPPKNENETPFSQELRSFLKDEGAAAMLLDSARSSGLLRVAYVAQNYDASEALPTAMLTHEDYALIGRLLQKGSVEMELALTNTFSKSSVEAHNVVGEIRGIERPDEVVIICAHLESWDLASGATDDGVGVVSVLEAMRAIKATGLQPRRTIRFVLFEGEEQHEVGSTDYVRRHHNEWPKISAVLADDTGAGRVTTIRLNQNYMAREAVDATLAPLQELGLIDPWMGRSYGSD